VFVDAMKKECEWCKNGFEQLFLDEDGTLAELTGKPGTWCHASDDFWWPCDAPPNEAIGDLCVIV